MAFNYNRFDLGVKTIEDLIDDAKKNYISGLMSELACIFPIKEYRPEDLNDDYDFYDYI